MQYGNYQAYQPMNLNTSINPAGIYTPQQTRSATNQAVADAYSGNNYYEARKRTMAPGRSAGVSTYRNALPTAIAGRVDAAQASAERPFADEQANARNILGGETAREAEALGWGGLGMQGQSNAYGIQNQRQGMGWSLLNQIMGW